MVMSATPSSPTAPRCMACGHRLTQLRLRCDGVSSTTRARWSSRCGWALLTAHLPEHDERLVECPSCLNLFSERDVSDHAPVTDDQARWQLAPEHQLDPWEVRTLGECLPLPDELDAWIRMGWVALVAVGG